MANIDLYSMNGSFQKMEKIFEEHGANAYSEILDKEDEGAFMLRAILDITKYCQLRNVHRIWLYRLKDPDLEDRRHERDESYGWEIINNLKTYHESDLYQFNKKLLEIVDEHPRDPKLQTALGFLAIEKQDYETASQSFLRAAMLTSNVPLEAWNEFLAARTDEVQGSFANAIQQYHQVARILPDPIECRYRALVCRVKMGFAEQTIDEMLELIKLYPELFNRFLIDPGLERGRVLILSTLHGVWIEAEQYATAEQQRLKELRNKFDAWFPPDEGHLFRSTFNSKLESVESLGEVKNYIAYLKIIEQRPILEEELNSNIEKIVDELRNRYKAYLNDLQIVRDEFSWFPFPVAMRDFGRSFNDAAEILNWAYSHDFNDVNIYKEASGRLKDLGALRKDLRMRLHSLQLVRDGTLFAMTMGKTFFITEIVGLVLSFIFLCVVFFFGSSLHLEWLSNMISANKISILEVLVVVITVMALGIAALRTTLVFDSRRDALVAKAKKKREQDQQVRLAQAKEKNRVKKEAARLERMAERE
ncbi:MAG: hypothetical protein IK079_05990, partial [Desulfovibrio sp.]|nr:hypothetical protein [Desulfovibrio sp.]